MSSSEETFMPAENLINAVDLEGWDNLITRGTKAEGVSKWERESLFLKFDPMLSKPSPSRGTTAAEKSVPLADVSNTHRHLGVPQQLSLVALDEEIEEFVVSPCVGKIEDDNVIQDQQQKQQPPAGNDSTQTIVVEDNHMITTEDEDKIRVDSPLCETNEDEANHKDTEVCDGFVEGDIFSLSKLDLEDHKEKVNEFCGLELGGDDWTKDCVSTIPMGETDGQIKHDENASSPGGGDEWVKDAAMTIQLPQAATVVEVDSYKKDQDVIEDQLFVTSDECEEPTKIETVANDQISEANNSHCQKDTSPACPLEGDEWTQVSLPKDSIVEINSQIKHDESKNSTVQDSHENLSRVLTNYENTMSDLSLQISDLQRKITVANREKKVAVEERDQTLEDLRNVESAFSDVHRKYERTKAVLDSLKKNEEMLKQRDMDMMQKIEMRDKKIEQLKVEAQNSLDSVYRDYELKIQQAESETHKLRALLRKHEMKIHSLENDLEQKQRENAELNALCDDLIKGKS